MPSIRPPIGPAELDAAAAFLRDGDDFLITSHVNSDGDGIGGGLAVARLLRQLGKRARVLLHELPEEGFSFLEGFGGIEAAGPSPDRTCPGAVILDCPNLDRLGGAAAYLSPRALVLNIDHHPDNERFGAVDLASPEVCSSCEMVYHLASHMGLEIDAATAEQLYTGIVFDTGGFRYSLTTPVSLEVGADLVRRGARLDVVADRIYNSASLASVKLLGRAIDSLELHGNGRVATLRLAYDDMCRGDSEGAVNYGLMIRGVEVSVLFKEEEPGRYRISLRSREAVDVAAVARAFAGGGHARAAGCRDEGDYEPVRQRLLEAVVRALP